MCRRIYSTAFSLLVAAIVLATEATWAHGMRVAAAPGGEGITGRCYYTDGTPARYEQVTLFNSDGARLAATQTDTEGRFGFTVRHPGEYTLVARGEEGHRAELNVRLGSGTGVSETAASEFDRDLLTLLLREELQPLREDLASYEQRIRIQDTVAGLCVIVGIAGALALWRSRRQYRGGD